MTLEEECALSYYKQIASFSDDHCIYLVQHVGNKHVYVKKILKVYNLEVFQYLKKHPVKNTPRIYEVVEDSKKLIVIEEYMSGVTLQEQLDRGVIFSEKAVINIVRQLCVILRQFHQSAPAIIHRDIKPSNIIISPDGILKLLDMNAAKWSHDNKGKDTVLIGTVGYAAPEQYGFGTSIVQTDIYAVGVLMNVLLSGKFIQEYIPEGRLKHIILRCTRLEPKERYQCVDALLQDMDKLDKPINVKRVTERSADTAAAPDALVKKDTSKKSIRYYAPPGFRTLKPGKMIVATLTYLFFIYASVTLVVKGETNPLVVWLNRIMFFSAYISEILFFSNYLDIQRKMGVLKIQNKWLRWGYRLVIGFVIFAVIVLLLGIFQSLLGV